MAIGTLPSGCHKQRELLIRRQIFTAFTLIELLVVIAIIAILAAILFPVFARAKDAAKATASISNSKQISTAMLMYNHDYDDYFIIGGQWHSDDPDACKRYASWYMPWTGLLEGYKKNLQVTDSPSVGPTTVPYTFSALNTCTTRRQCSLLYPTYGYNMTYLSPSYATDFKITSISSGAVERPASQVMLTEIWSPNNTKFGVFAAGSDTYYISFGSSEVPDGTSPQAGLPKPTSFDGWGISAIRNIQIPTEQEGRYAAGVAFRVTRMTPVTFADGHVKRMTPEQLAIGTNWRSGVTNKGQVTRILNGTYLWDPRGL